MGIYPIDSNEEITIDAQAKAMFTNDAPKTTSRSALLFSAPKNMNTRLRSTAR